MNPAPSPHPSFAEAALDRFLTPQTRDGSPRDVTILASAKTRRVPYRQSLEFPHTIVREPIELAVYQWGEPGCPVVGIVHGWEFQAGRMGRFVQPLVNAGYRVVALDLPAHGASGGQLLNIGDGALALAAACAGAGEVVSVIGHSFGGLVALWFAAQHPPASLTSVVTLASGTGAEYMTASLARAENWDAAHERAYRDAFAARFGNPPAFFSVERFGRHVRVPALVIQDQRDAFFPFEVSDRILSSLPAARRLATRGLGHVAITRDAEVIAATIRHIQAPRSAEPA